MFHYSTDFFFLLQIDFLLAPSRQIFDMVLKRCEEILQYETKLIDSGLSTNTSQFSLESESFREPALIDYPEDRSILSTIIFYSTYPFAFLMHFTIPDVREMSESGDPTISLFRAYTSTIMCLIWLIIGSYAMVASLESLAGKRNRNKSIVIFNS